MIRIASLAAFALLAAPALAQEAPPAKAERPLISVGYGSEFGIFVETPLANPGSTVEVWSWMIQKEPKQIPGGALYDITVSRELIDCVGWKRSQLYADGFLGETYLGRSTGGVTDRPIGQAVDAAVANIVCGKVDVSKTPRIADIAAARQLNHDYFFKPISSK